jgi:hypothetical protein
VTPPVRRYRLFGLQVASEIELPELFGIEAGAQSGAADIMIVRGAVVAAGAGSVDGVMAVGDGATLEVADVARFHVVGGKTITVDARPGAPEANVRLFLLGSASAILIYQRGLLPLHANAVEIGGRAVAFLGESGAGKSTLAAWFNDRGARILSDDVCVIEFGGGGADDGAPLAMPGLPRYRLWRDALIRSGRNAADHPRSYLGDDDYDKYDVAVPAAYSADAPLPVAALYVLERGETFAVEPLDGMAATQALFAHSYRGGYLSVIGGHEAHWRSCMRLIHSIPVFRAQRRWDVAAIDEQNAALLDHARGLSRILAQL